MMNVNNCKTKNIQRSSDFCRAARKETHSRRQINAKAPREAKTEEKSEKAKGKKREPYPHAQCRLQRGARGAQNPHETDRLNRQIVASAVVRLRLVRVGQHLCARREAERGREWMAM